MWKYIAPFLVSMVPILELRGGVLLGMGMGLDQVTAVIICVIGNMLPVPFVYFLARKVLTYGSDKKFFGSMCRFFLQKGECAGQKLTEKTGRYGTFIALMLFVGIPLPGTGAWTGTMAASFLNIGVKTTTASVSLGVIIAGIIMACFGTAVFSIF